MSVERLPLGPSQRRCRTDACRSFARVGSLYCPRCTESITRNRRTAGRLKLYAVVGAQLIKLGITHKPVMQRLATMQTSSPVTLRLLGSCGIAGDWVERAAHAILADDRSHGEWFRATDAVLQVTEWIVDEDSTALEAWAREGLQRLARIRELTG